MQAVAWIASRGGWRVAALQALSHEDCEREPPSMRKVRPHSRQPWAISRHSQLAPPGSETREQNRQ